MNGTVNQVKARSSKNVLLRPPVDQPIECAPPIDHPRAAGRVAGDQANGSHLLQVEDAVRISLNERCVELQVHWLLLPWLKFFHFMAPALVLGNKIELIATVSRNDGLSMRTSVVARAFVARTWIDHLYDLCDPLGVEAAALRMLLHYRFILSKVDTEQLVCGDKRFQPLDIRPKFTKHSIRLRCSCLNLLCIEGTNL
jgi:hypothetical protein